MRRPPVGAEVAADGGAVHFRVWAPGRRRVAVLLEGGPGAGRRVGLGAEPGGYFAGAVEGAAAGSRYRFLLDDDPRPYADPASRFQPEGPHGPSEVVDPSGFAWADGGWPGVAPEGQVVYEMHVGTFTPEGTWAAAAEQLPELARLGITAVEMMPVADFAGAFGWGYDGVNLYAPTRLYGAPDDLRRFVDRAHASGLGVILDVVCNHLGADGNDLARFAAAYFTDRYENEWGAAINFDGEDAGPVREFVVANAGYWIDEFHFDGLRLDAANQMHDASGRHMLTEIGARVRAAARGRGTCLVAESEPQLTRMVRPEDRGGHGLDAMWNEDWHHSAMVAVTGRAEAYYSAHRGFAQEFVSAAKYGFLYQGQVYSWQRKPRGAPALDFEPWRFVNYLQNHEQIANTGRGKRAHQLTSPGRYRALTAVLLLGPQTPMLFQGQEFAASTPFRYFNDASPELADPVRKGRFEFLSQFESLAEPGMRSRLPDPADPATFRSCKLDFAERGRHGGIYALHRDLLRLRREDPAFARACRGGRVDGAVLADEAFLLRYFGDDGDDRLLLVDLGRDLVLDPAPEPLLAPPEGRTWRVLWSSEDPRYGGIRRICGEEEAWRLTGHGAVVLAPAARPGREAGR